MLYLSKYIEIIVIISSVLLHEASHVLLAYIFGYRNIKVELSMFGGMCYMNIDNKRKTSSTIIYISGCVMNLLIIFVTLICENIYKINNSFEFINILQIYRHYNIILLVFSLLPIYPLDGFRLLDIYLKDNVVYKLSYIFIGIIFILNIYFKSVGMLIVLIFLLYKNIKMKDELVNNKLKLICNHLLNKQLLT